MIFGKTYKDKRNFKNKKAAEKFIKLKFAFFPKKIDYSIKPDELCGKWIWFQWYIAINTKTLNWMASHPNRSIDSIEIKSGDNYIIIPINKAVRDIYVEKAISDILAKSIDTNAYPTTRNLFLGLSSLSNFTNKYDQILAKTLDFKNVL